MIAAVGVGLALMCDPATGSGLDARQMIDGFMRASAAADADALEALLDDDADMRTSDGSMVLPRELLLSAARSEEPARYGDYRLHSWLETGRRVAVVAEYGPADSQLFVFEFSDGCISRVTVFV